MRFLGSVSIAMFIVVSATTAWALSGPKVAVTYSMEGRDGGRYATQLTGTPLGAGDQIYIADIDDDCKGSDPYGSGDALCGASSTTNGVEVPTAGAILPIDPFTAAAPGPVVTSPGDNRMTFTIEYTADLAGNIVSGPVALIERTTDQILVVSAAGGLSTTVSDLTKELAIDATGSYDGVGTITWATPWSTISTGTTQCGGDATICSLAAPPGGWPRIESGTPDFIKNGNPGACPLRPGLVIPAIPTFAVSASESIVDTNNGTPDFFTDDVLITCDTQVVAYESWYGVETSRRFVAAASVPMLGPLGQVGIGIMLAGAGLLVRGRARQS